MQVRRARNGCFGLLPGVVALAALAAAREGGRERGSDEGSEGGGRNEGRKCKSADGLAASREWQLHILGGSNWSKLGPELRGIMASTPRISVM
jgi:hypothetical protein